MDSEDKIIAGLQQLHNDLERLCAVIKETNAQTLTESQQRYEQQVARVKEHHEQTLARVKSDMEHLNDVVKENSAHALAQSQQRYEQQVIRVKEQHEQILARFKEQNEQTLARVKEQLRYYRRLSAIYWPALEILYQRTC
ncbi:MAG TPA: hypothetical protein VMU16_10260 [Candidatus Binataceae bacterium]|nr:hypothetical protein [Candidatus Binataceae bacterium]